MKLKKNAIVQISIPAKGWEQENHIKYQSEEVVSLSVKLSQIYAKRVNAQHFLISKQKYFLNTLLGKDFNYLKMGG